MFSHFETVLIVMNLFVVCVTVFSPLLCAGCTSAAVPHMRVPPCVCSGWAALIQSDQPPVPQLPLSRPLMTPADRCGQLVKGQF